METSDLLPLKWSIHSKKNDFEFTNKSLEAQVREWIGQPSGRLATAEIESIRAIFIQHPCPSMLEDLQRMKHLAVLMVYDEDYEIVKHWHTFRIHRI